MAQALAVTFGRLRAKPLAFNIAATKAMKASFGAPFFELLVGRRMPKNCFLKLLSSVSLGVL
jgi:hypothetical protein